MKHSFLLLIVAAMLSSCATYEVIPFGPGHKSTNNVKGFRVYTPQPYVIISKTADDKSTLDIKLVYLPDTSSGYIIKNKGGMGKSELNFKLENGWSLTEFGAISDSQLPETLTSIGGLLEIIQPMTESLLTNQGQKKEDTVEGIYKVDMQNAKLIKLN